MIRKNKFTITLKTLILIWGLSLLLGFSLHAKAQQNNLPGDTLLPSSKQELEKLAELDVGNYKYSNNPRVNINESDQIVKSLRARGFDTPYMVKYNEGHGFRHEENRIELYRSMMGFFLNV